MKTPASDDAFGSETVNRTRDAIEYLLPVALVVMLVDHYPSWTAQRSSLGQYFNGVYRSRVLGRELILGIANLVDQLAGATGRGRLPGFQVGWVAVTGGGFILTWSLLRRHRRAHAPALGPVELAVATAIAVSATVLTPYDTLSYALIVATVIAATSHRTAATAVFAAAAVATRESGLLVTAIIAASCVNPPPDGHRGADHVARSATWRSEHRLRPLYTAAISATTTYAILKLTSRQSTHVALFQPMALKANLTGGAAAGIALAAALLIATRWSLGPLQPADHVRRRVLWLLALPYLVVLVIGASWDEAPRLVMPLLIGEALLIIDARSRRPCAPQPSVVSGCVGEEAVGLDESACECAE